MTILRKIVGTTTLTAVLGTGLYFYSDEKIKSKVKTQYDKLKEKIPLFNNLIEDQKSEPVSKD